MSRDLKFPIIKGLRLKPRVLNMDEYLRFVEWNHENLPRVPLTDEEIRKRMVKAKFVLKEE